MWATVWSWAKRLIAGEGSSQFGSRNQSASGVSVGDNASVVAVGQAITVVQGSSPTAASADTFQTIERQIPALLAEMRKDLVQHPFAREIVILTKTCVYNASPHKTTLIYYFEDHSDLRNKLRILENHGLIHDITYNNTERFVMAEGLAAYLTGRE